MYKLIGSATLLVALSACGVGSNNGYNTYCVEEQEANGLDYMIVSDKSVCDNPNADAEYYSTDERFNIGDIAFVESDSDHSVKRSRKYTEIKKVTTFPAYVPATTKVNVVPTPIKTTSKSQPTSIPKYIPPTTATKKSTR